ncbi:MAG: alcohol dehydrogenase catalytic domain-containing protein [Clostridia bacterium]|nr:alcohol dehydrogenase catalytic domain-containing protein [Clostridia bacterium]
MKAAVWTDIDKLEIKEVPTPTIAEEQALIKVRAAGVCVTDYHIISGKLKLGKMPHIQGHEICGEVYEINSKRTDVKVGQRCVIATSIGCGHCDMCREGKVYLCNDSQEIGYYPHNGGYAEYVKVPVSAIVPITDNVSDKAGAILESCVCPTESLMNANIPLNSTVLVTGNGPAALAYIMLAKIMGAGKVISVVRDAQKEQLTLSFGATHVINSKTQNVEDELVKITNGKKAEVVIEATGAPAVIEKCFDYCAKGGKIIQYGIPGDEDKVNLPVKKVVTEEITYLGAVGNVKAWYPLVELIDAGKLNLEKMVTHEFTLDQIDKAFDLYRNHDRELIKAIIKF